MYEENNIYKKILNDRLKEIEFWKRKYIENCKKFQPKINSNLIITIFDFFTNNFKISFDFKDRSNFKEEYDILQKLIKKDLEQENFIRYFKKIDSNYNSILEEKNDIIKILKTLKLELLENIEKENKKEKIENKNFNLLKNNYFNSLESFNEDLIEIIDKNKNLEEKENVVNLCKFHLEQINIFNKLLLKENIFYKMRIDDLKNSNLSNNKILLDNLITKIEYLFNEKNCEKILSEIKNLENINFVG